MGTVSCVRQGIVIPLLFAIDYQVPHQNVKKMVYASFHDGQMLITVYYKIAFLRCNTPTGESRRQI